MEGSECVSIEQKTGSDGKPYLEIKLKGTYGWFIISSNLCYETFAVGKWYDISVSETVQKELVK